MTNDNQNLSSNGEGTRELESITPPEIFGELEKGVLGQSTALRYTSVAVY